MTPKEYLATLDPKTAADSQTLLTMMQRISSQKPKLENAGTLAFDSYHYKYDSGREGDALVIGFYPRKNKITVYLMDGTARHSELLTKLGKHSTTGYCIYIKQLTDVDLSVLEQIIKNSYDFIKLKSKNGPIDKILWKTE